MLVASTLWPVAAIAEEPPSASALGGGPSSEAARAKAQPLFARGMALLKEQRWNEGLEAFTAAYAILPSPYLRFNIGYCQRALGQYVAALDSFRRFLAEPMNTRAETRRTEAEGYVQELEGRIASLHVTVVREFRPDLDLLLDGRKVPVGADGRVDSMLDPGRHTIAARKPGFTPLYVDRDLHPGESAEMELRMEPLPARVQVSSNVPGSSVLVDGKGVGVAPWDADMAPGRHTIRVTATGYLPHESELSLGPGDAARVTATLAVIPPKPTPIYRRWWFWSGLAVVVGGVATGTYFAVRPAPQPMPYDGGSINWVAGHH
jgi:hypothetical protein